MGAARPTQWQLLFSHNRKRNVWLGICTYNSVMMVWLKRNWGCFSLKAEYVVVNKRNFWRIGIFHLDDDGWWQTHTHTLTKPWTNGYHQKMGLSGYLLATLRHHHLRICVTWLSHFITRAIHISFDSMVMWCTREKQQNHINISPKTTMTGNCILYSPAEEKGRWRENAKPPLMMLKSNS